MPVRLHHIVVDARDLPALARFWAQALGWKVLSERENEIVIGTDENVPAGMCFMPVTDPKTVKNRVHLDLTSCAADRDQEIDRLLALGARRVGIGQAGAESWIVLADPEGNEFCTVRPKERSSDEAQHREPQTDPVRSMSGRLLLRNHERPVVVVNVPAARVQWRVACLGC
jgi:predicted enzyme related to lactoylglutathione lyase